MTYRDRRIVVFVPYGRERTVSILSAYLRRDAARGIIDEVMVCLNTDTAQQKDRDYAERLAATDPLFQLYRRPGEPGWESSCPAAPPAIPPHWRDGPLHPKQMNTGRFFVYMQEPDTIYVRMDDDLVWVHADALTALVDAKLDRHPDALAVFPVIWNNAVSTSFLQWQGRLPAHWQQVGTSAVDPVGWGDAAYAEQLHRYVLDSLEAGVELPFSDDLQLGPRQQFSVSCFAIEGREYAACGGVLSYEEEEHWLTMHRTGELGRTNWVVGSAHVAHWTFFTQAQHLNRTDLLDRYRSLADQA